MWREIKKIIHQKQNFLITTHENPDGDGIGAACAFIELLKFMGKEVRFVCDSSISPKFFFLDFHKIYERYDSNHSYQDVEVVVIVDTHKKDRIGRLTELITRPNIITICIDHHISSESISPYTAIDSNASSSGSMVYTLFKECGYDLNYEAAMGLYASIICDTGRFSYSSTDRKAHKIAEECIKKGVDPDWMYSHLYRQVTLSEFKVFSRALQRMEIHCDNRVIVQTICYSDYEALGNDVTGMLCNDLEYVHEFNKLVMDVECVILLREMPDNKVRLSLRSNTDLRIDKITQVLGGGGHSKAAGATVTGTLESVKKTVIGLVEDLLGGKKLMLNSST